MPEAWGIDSQLVRGSDVRMLWHMRRDVQKTQELATASALIKAESKMPRKKTMRNLAKQIKTQNYRSTGN